MLIDNSPKEPQPIRLAVNATALLSPLTGIGQYVWALMNSLQLRGEVDANHFYASRWSTNLYKPPLNQYPHQIKIAVRRFLPNAYEINRWLQQRRFSSGLKSWKADVYHEPNFLAFDFDGPLVLTVHDLSWIRYPETHPKERVRDMNRHFERSLLRANQVITDTQFTQSELITLFGVNPDKIHPIHLGAETLFRPMIPSETTNLLRSRGLRHGSYWLFVGTLEPRKNLSLIFEALSALPKDCRRRCPLVVMGMPGWGTKRWPVHVRQSIDSGEIIFTGYMPRRQQASVMAGAKALIYPSLYEGFGLPIVEAMRCGVPVIASNASCLPEVVGGAGALVDPHDPYELSELMRRILDDKAVLDDLASKALLRSRDFSWKKCAEQTLNVYKIAL